MNLSAGCSSAGSHTPAHGSTNSKVTKEVCDGSNIPGSHTPAHGSANSKVTMLIVK